MASRKASGAGGPGLPPVTPTTSKFIDVSAALIFRHRRLLITQRAAQSHLGGCWEFPGGKRERDETPEQCLVREIQEELGVTIAVGELFEDLSHVYPEKAVHLQFFICALVSGEPSPLDCAAVKWIAKAQLDAHQFPPADARLLDKLKGLPAWD